MKTCFLLTIMTLAYATAVAQNFEGVFHIVGPEKPLPIAHQPKDWYDSAKDCQSPEDEIARGYERFLMYGEGGAYLAITGLQETVLQAATTVGIAAEPLNAGRIRYVTFPEPELGALFFVESGYHIVDPDSILTHSNGAEGIRRVWIEASHDFGRLLEALGATKCGIVPLPDGRTGAAYGLSNGEVVLVSVAMPVLHLRSGGHLRMNVNVFPEHKR